VKYQKMWDVTAAIVKSWDPYGLISGGAPANEFDQEIASLIAQIPRIHSAADATRAVSRIFASNFEAHSFTDENCSAVGEKLYAALKEHGIIN
jgi:hypothetical protein